MDELFGQAIKACPVEFELKRVGSVLVTDILDDYVYLRIVLDGEPSELWKECFRYTKTREYNEAHPTNALVVGNSILFHSVRSRIENNIELMDSYIEQANAACNQTTDKQQKDVQRKQQKVEEQRKAKQAEIGRINKYLKEKSTP